MYFKFYFSSIFLVCSFYLWPNEYQTFYNMANLLTQQDNKTLAERRKEVREYCRLPKLDPWDPSIISLLKFVSKHCTPQIEIITSLVNGKLEIIKKVIENTSICEFRCLYKKNDYEMIYGDWYNFTAKPDCDIVEVVCKNKTTNNVFYTYLHTQIYRKPIPKNSTISSNETRLPDVHVIVFDSSFSSNFHRSMVRTIHYWREKYDAISFPYFNKVAVGSMQNGWACFIGKYMEEAKIDACKTPIETEQFIGFEYYDRGYKTMMSEDWASGLYNLPNCIGPFFMRTDYTSMFIKNGSYKSEELAANMYAKSCNLPHVYILDYLKKFIDAYENEPKFSIQWMAHLAHNEVNGLYDADFDYYKFFKEYMEKLKDSFIIMMGDHGIRYGEFRKTKVGEIEDNNPALFMIVPERFRKNNEFMNVVRNNAKQLVTHFDIYATLVDITRNPFFTKSQPIFTKNLFLRGSSLLKLLPQPRNCQKLDIHLDYCICQRQHAPVTDPVFTKRIGQFMVDWINEYIDSFNVSNKCAWLYLKPNSTKVEEYEPRFHVDIYTVSIKVEPSGGTFSGYVAKNFDALQNETVFEMISEKPARINAYKGQSDCVKENGNIAPYCYCRNLIKLKEKQTPEKGQNKPKLPNSPKKKN